MYNNSTVLIWHQIMGKLLGFFSQSGQSANCLSPDLRILRPNLTVLTKIGSNKKNKNNQTTQSL
jgi:hypothetical protein